MLHPEPKKSAALYRKISRIRVGQGERKRVVACHPALHGCESAVRVKSTAADRCRKVLINSQTTAPYSIKRLTCTTCGSHARRRITVSADDRRPPRVAPI